MSWQALIHSRWKRSYRYDNDYMKLTEPDSYFAAYTRYIDLILNRRFTTVAVAVLAEDPDNILGFCVQEPEILHYVHVHKYHRRQGIAKFLVSADCKRFTHLTRTGMKLWATKLPQAVFDPFA